MGQRIPEKEIANFQFVERIDAILLVVFTPAYTPFGRSFALKDHNKSTRRIVVLYAFWGCEKLILFKNMNRTGAGMVSDTVAAPVFCHFRAQNPHYFWYFFAEQRARKFCE